MPEVEVGGKRSNDELVDEYGEIDAYSKKSKPEDIPNTENMKARLLLVGKNCGAIIGKGGENISRLRREYNVEVNMPATRTTDRVITLCGAVDDCIALIKDILPACTSAPHPVDRGCAYELNILVHTEAVGTVIGKAGAKIKEIREQSDGKIKVYQDCLAKSNERVIAVGGDDEVQTLTALKIVFLLLKDQPRRATLEYDPAHKESVGAARGSWPGTLGDGGFSFANRTMSNKIMTNTGTPTPLMGMKDSNDHSQSEFLKLQTTTSITVPNELVGAIIGKAGMRIREIRNTSGAKIQFSESDKETKEDRVITMSGTQQQIQIAERLMTDCVRNRSS